MENTDDQHIIDLVKKGHIQSYSILVDRYKNMIYSLCFKMIKNKEEAEEAAQDSFIKAFKNIDKFKNESKFSTWLYKVAYNTCLDSLKKINKTQHVELVESYASNHYKREDSIAGFLADDLQEQIIQNCLSQLPGDENLIITLFYFEELSIEEISEIINLKPNNIKVKLHRIRKKLALLLKDKLESNYEYLRKL